jgi:hypothetical protein
VTDAVEQAQDVLAAVKSLSTEVRQSQAAITIAQARVIHARCREAEDWLLGVRKLLEVGRYDGENRSVEENQGVH